MFEVSIVIVCMNNLNNLFQCLNSIKINTTLNYETLVVAYKFSDKNLQKLEKNYPWITIIESNEIRGFAENNNLALKKATGKYCFIINDDTKFNNNIIKQLVETFNSLPDDIAVVSPKIMNIDGSIQFSGRPKINWKTYLLSQLGIWKESKIKSKYTNKSGIFQTYNISGAAFIIRTCILNKLDYFDEYYFFTPEDIALSTKLNKNGYKCYVNSKIEIIHFEGQSGISNVSKIKIATLPAGEKGTVRFLANSSIILYNFLSLYAFIFSIMRFLKYKLKSKKINDRYHIISQATLNISKSILSNRTPKEIFIKYYNKIEH